MLSTSRPQRARLGLVSLASLACNRAIRSFGHTVGSSIPTVLNASFTVSSVMMVIGLTQLGLLTVPVAAVSIVGLIPVYFGIKIGSRLREKISPEMFRKLVLFTLIVLGGVLIMRLGFMP